MGLFDRFAQLFSDWRWLRRGPDLHELHALNPSTGLSMIGAMGSVDVVGNPLDTDLHRHHYDDDDWSRHDRWETGSAYDSSMRWHDSYSSRGIGGGHDL